MIEFKSIHLLALQNAAHMEFVNSVVAEVNKLGNLPTVDNARRAVELVNAARDKEDENFQLSQKSNYTADITAADKERDANYTSFKKVVDAYRKLPTPMMAEAAKKIWEVIQVYKINVNMRLDSETALIDNLVQDLEGKLMSEVLTLNLHQVVQDMKAANLRVRELVSSRTDESATRVAGALKTSRAESDEAIKNVLHAISSMAFVFGDESYSEFAKRYNVLVERYKKQISSASSKKKGESEEEVEE